MKFMPPKPDWLHYGCTAFTREAFDHWYAKEIAPLFENASEVYTTCVLGFWTTSATLSNDHRFNHKALLINIQPIKEDTAEDILKEVVEWWKSYPDDDHAEYVNKARKYLGRKK
jgi:hypothetical protein